MNVKDKATALQNAKEMADHEVLTLSIKNPQVFEVLVDRYEEPFLNKTNAILKNKEQAQDVVQDTFVKIYLNAGRFELQEGASFKSWGYKILLNTCFTYCKKKNRERDFVSNVDQDILNTFGAAGEEEKKLDLDQFLSVVSKLPETFARMLKLVAIEGKTHEDVAEAEGISVGAARTRLHRARKEFRKVSATL